MAREQIMTYAKVRAAAARAYRMGRLTAQQTTPRDRQCVYALPWRPECRCPVGHAMTLLTLKRVHAVPDGNGNSIAELAYVVRGRATLRTPLVQKRRDSLYPVRFATTRDLERTTRLQEVHDAWCDDHGAAYEMTAGERLFCRMVGVAPRLDSGPILQLRRTAAV